MRWTVCERDVRDRERVRSKKEDERKDHEDDIHIVSEHDTALVFAAKAEPEIRLRLLHTEYFILR